MKVLKIVVAYILLLGMTVTIAACKASTDGETTTAELTTSAKPTTMATPTTTQPGTTTEEPATTAIPTTTQTGSQPHVTAAAPTTTVPSPTITSTEKFMSVGENFGWQQRGITLDEVYKGNVRITFDMTSTLEKVGALVGFAAYDSTVSGYDDLAM